MVLYSLVLLYMRMLNDIEIADRKLKKKKKYCWYAKQLIDTYVKTL